MYELCVVYLSDPVALSTTMYMSEYNVLSEKQAEELWMATPQTIRFVDAIS